MIYAQDKNGLHQITQVYELEISKLQDAKYLIFDLGLEI